MVKIYTARNNREAGIFLSSVAYKYHAEIIRGSRIHKYPTGKCIDAKKLVIERVVTNGKKYNTSNISARTIGITYTLLLYGRKRKIAGISAKKIYVIFVNSPF